MFIGTNCKSIKVLQWHNNGFLLNYKKLEAGRLSLLAKHDDNPFVELECPELRRLITRIKQRSPMSELKQKAILNR